MQATTFTFLNTLGALLCAVPLTTLAADRCKTVNWKPGDIVTVSASLHKATHVVLPENHIDVIVGENELWAAEFVANHLYLKPTSKMAAGAETTISFVGESNQSYEFIAKRTSGKHATCVTITPDGSMINKQAWKQSSLKAKRGQLSRADVQREARRQTQAVTKELVSQTEDALRVYRKQIFTGYKFNRGKGWHSYGGELVESVYDDGRFTFIRVNDDSRGLMAVYASIDGKKELLEYEYDAPTMVYQVNGVFPEFEMQQGKSKVLVRREES